jgi:hypothetical protein
LEDSVVLEELPNFTDLPKTSVCETSTTICDVDVGVNNVEDASNVSNVGNETTTPVEGCPVLIKHGLREGQPCGIKTKLVGGMCLKHYKLSANAK